jgi:guanylate kinase
MSQKVLGNLPEGLIFVLSAPAGTGKTTLVSMLRSEFSCVTESISSTTRPPRGEEIPGKDYFFLTEAEFEAKIKAGEFLEYAKVFGHYYGTSKEYVTQQREKGKHVVLVIDTQGALQLMGKFPATFVFVSPPSLQELRERLFKRKTETVEMIEQRLSWAKQEIELAGKYNYHIINDNLHTAYEVLRSILVAEEHKVRKK